MRIQVNGTTLNVFQKSAVRAPHSAITLLFLHYFGGSSQSWIEVIDVLACDYTCVAPDLRGFGGSEGSAAASYTVKDYADDVAALVDDLKLKRYVLIGHSMGGKIALQFAARQPSGLASLVLLAPSPPTPEPMEDAERTRLLAGHGVRFAAEETARKITAHPLAASVSKMIVEDNLRSSRPAWLAWLDHGSREDISGEVSSIKVPVMVVAGAADPVITATLLEREVVRRVAGARLAVLSNVGHLLPLEDPKTVAALIRERSQFTSLSS